MDMGLLAAAFAFGFGARAMGLPPLVGYLVAGFALHALGYESSPAIEAISDLGVLLLLFGIGLKLKVKTLGRRQVWATATVHATGVTVLFGAILLGLGALGLPLARDLDLGSAAIVGFAFSFSSTVFAVKALEETNESASLAGRVAVGVLIVQDLLAVVFLLLADGRLPSIWAVPVIAAFFFLRPLLGWVLDRSGHGEVLVLLGFTLALGLGAGAFEAVGLKPDLGALAAGLVLSTHPRAGELSDRLLGFKDLLLVGFFLSVGLAGAPSPAAWAIGLIATVLVVVKTAGFGWLLTRFRLRSRTAFHASLPLTSYSEFGLIVVSAALASGLLGREWISVLAVAVSSSLVAAAVLNTIRFRLYERWSERLSALDRGIPVPEDAVVDCGFARVLIFGMGRVGTGAYDEMVERRGKVVVGVDRGSETVERHERERRSVIRGDALDRDFWERVRFHPEVELVVAAMNSHAANLELVRRVREFLPEAKLAAIATYPDQVEELQKAGVDVARNLYEEAGQALADDAVGVVWGGRQGPSVEG
jgi:glutathione-regulated potassium-efflux system ancillary protein KefC